MVTATNMVLVSFDSLKTKSSMEGEIFQIC